MQLPRYKVLLMDDEVYLIQALKVALEIFGNFEVFTAPNGAQGLELCATHHPHVIVLDVRMPQLNGYQVVRALRGDPATAQLPLILLSAMAQPRDRLIGLMSDVDIYLEKPVSPQHLIDAIHQALGFSQQEREERLRRLAESPQS